MPAYLDPGHPGPIFIPCCFVLAPLGLAVELFKSVPYGKRAILVAKQSNVDELFQKVRL